MSLTSIPRHLSEKLKSALIAEYKKRFPEKSFVPGLDSVPVSGKIFNEKEILMMVESVMDGWWTEGRFAENFEHEMARFLGIKYVSLLNSGSSANLVALAALTSKRLGERRLKPGDEVIGVAAGFPTTVNPIIQYGLIPVFVDVDLGHYNANIDEIEQAIGPKTRAIFLAHTLGNPYDLDAIARLCKIHNLWFIEDNCDALGSQYKGKFTGHFGHIATCSFYPAHHITMGEGGAVFTDDPVLDKLVKSFRDWGRDCWCKTGKNDTCGKRFGWQLGALPKGYDHKYVYSEIGYNLKITDMQAALGLAQIKKLPDFIRKRKINFRHLYEGLKRYENYFILPQWLDDAEPSWFGFAITVRDNAPFTRDDIVKALKNRKIATRYLFAGNLVKQPYFARGDIPYRISGTLKNTDIIMNQTFWIGCYPGLNQVHLDYVLSSIETFVSNVEG